MMIVMAIAIGDFQSAGWEGCVDGGEYGKLTMALQGGLSMSLMDVQPSDKAYLKAACSQQSPIVPR